jgi:hypothetical protein
MLTSKFNNVLPKICFCRHLNTNPTENSVLAKEPEIYAILRASPSPEKIDLINRFFMNSSKTHFLGSTNSAENYETFIKPYLHLAQVCKKYVYYS